MLRKGDTARSGKKWIRAGGRLLVETELKP